MSGIITLPDCKLIPVGLIGDAGALALSGEAATPGLLALTEGFTHETDYLVVSASPFLHISVFYRYLAPCLLRTISFFERVSTDNLYQ